MLQQVVDHLVRNALPAASDYEDAEAALSDAYPPLRRAHSR